MKISNTNGANFVKRIEKSDNTYDKQISVSSDDNNNQPKNVERNLTQNTNKNINYQQFNLSYQENSKLIKDLLNLPKDMKELLALFLDKKNLDEVSLKLLENTKVKVDIEQIRNLIDLNSKEVINKLIKLVQQNSNTPQSGDQIKEILSVLSQVLPQNKTLSQETLKSLILLYLPWLPLTPPQDIKLELQNKNDDEEDEGEYEKLVILITTANIGRFKIALVINKVGHLTVNVECQQMEDLDKLQEKILIQINEKIRELNLVSKTEFYETEPPKNELNDKRNVSFYQITKISPRLVICAHSITKLIFELDENIQLIKARKEMLDK